MSLLEDVFLADEAGEAQDLERIIEGDEFDDRPRSRADDSDENSAREDEAEEEKVRVDPTDAKPKRVIKNPRFVLNPARLTGPRGIQVLPEHFKDFKFKGKGHEKSDLDLMLKKLEHWAYRLYPKFQFEDCLKKIETLGKKRAVAVHLTKLRMDMLTSDETVVQKDSSDDEAQGPSAPEEQDEFDKLLQQQIAIARATPAPASVKKTPFAERASLMPKATSSPSINDEQRERMLRNRQKAEERRLAKLKQKTSQGNGIENDLITENFPSDDANVNAGEKDVTNAKGNKNDIVEFDDNGIVVSSSRVPVKKHKISDDGNLNGAIDINDSGKDIVEIDNDQVTKSPRTYVPAKKHNRSRIDSSDDDVSEPVIVDLENHHNDLKSNINNSKADITDSSDDENVSELITIDVENHLNSGRTKKPNVIDSSDDDEPLVMNESITVDVHGSNKDVTAKKHKISNDGNLNGAIDINDSGKDIVDIDNDQLTKSPRTYVPAKKHNRSRIDSSDDDEPLVMNESITVDVYGSNKDETNRNKHDNSNTSESNSNEKEINVNDSLFDTLIANDAGIENIVEVGEVNELDSVKSNLNSTNVSNYSNIEMNKCSETVRNSDNNKVSQIDEGEKLMDVDFSVDF